MREFITIIPQLSSFTFREKREMYEGWIAENISEFAKANNLSLNNIKKKRITFIRGGNGIYSTGGYYRVLCEVDYR